MVKIMVAELKDKAKELAEFLTQKLGAKAELLGETIIVEESGERAGSRIVKTYIKRFLHLQGIRTQYKLTLQKGEFRLHLMQGEVEEEKEE